MMETQEGTISVISEKKDQMNGIELVMILRQEIFLQVMYQNTDMLFYMKDLRFLFYSLINFQQKAYVISNTIECS